jgi:HEAT repeats
MAEAPDCREAQARLRRAVTGVAVGDGELERALAHIATCELCAARVEVARTAACEELEEDLPEAARLLREGEDVASRHPDLARHLEECEWCRATLAELLKEPELLSEAETGVDPSELFERSLAAALVDPEVIVRVRAAERLGATPRVGPQALAALADAAAEDSEPEVRAAALRALDELDEAVSISERLIAAWSAEPEEAARFIEGVLRRLAGGQPPAMPGVAELVGSTWTPEQRMPLSGPEGIRGSLSATEGELHLTVEGLPPRFEETTPVIAVPRALRASAPKIEWSGKEPGLVSTEAAVRDGRLDVRLGRMLDPSVEPTLTPELERLFVLNPEVSRPSA